MGIHECLHEFKGSNMNSKSTIWNVTPVWYRLFLVLGIAGAFFGSLQWISV